MKAKSVSELFLTILLLNCRIISGYHISQDQQICIPDKSYDGSVHALGNGRMLVYEKGAEIFKIYSGCYSTPSLFTVSMADSSDILTCSSREHGTAVWKHEVFHNGTSAGFFIDFVDSQLPCMVRHFKISETISFRMKMREYVEVYAIPDPRKIKTGNQGLLLMVPAGTIFYQKYTYPAPLCFRITGQGNVRIEEPATGKNEYLITIAPGESDLFLTGGPEYPQAVENSEEAVKLTAGKMLERTRAWWKAFSAGRTDFDKLLPPDIPQRQKLLETIDDVSVMIRTQQASEGSVMAGYPYPLGYVRDQYGVSRGLLALGYAEEARKILEFYWNIWRKYGVVHNAQGIGVEGIFHIHENDGSETPGYLLIQAFDLLDKTGDDNFTEVIFPMLEWCWEVQKKQLVHGMMPFNGDETYVAGGFLPRSALNDGSAEATILFTDGGTRLLNWIRQHNKWSAGKLEDEKKLLEETRSLFRENFLRNGQLITNNPDRIKYTAIPRFRHGVCERSGPGCIVSGRKGFSGIDWTEKDINNRYQCPACLASGPLPKVPPEQYNLISVSLFPLYINSSLVKVSELRSVVESVFSAYTKTGVLSCTTQAAGSSDNKRTVGYDYGFLLYAMVETGAGDPVTIYEKILSVADQTGVWAEYYDNDKPLGTRYRPWESAINLEALIKFASHYK